MGRNATLDYFKIFLSILVVTIHVHPLFAENSLAGWSISHGLARIAVPCFFVINGYFFFTKIENWTATKKYLLHLILIYVVWTILYSVILFPNWIIYATKTNTIKSILSGYYHLWYLPALIYGIAFTAILFKFIKKPIIIFVVAVTLMLAGYFLASEGSLYGRYLSGCSYIILGCFLKKYDLSYKISTPIIIFITVINLVLLMMNCYSDYLRTFSSEVHLPLFFIAPCLIMLLIKYGKSYKKPSIYISNLSSGIYFLHIAVIFKLPYPAAIGYTSIAHFGAIVLVTMALSIILIFINKYIKIFF